MVSPYARSNLYLTESFGNIPEQPISVNLSSANTSRDKDMGETEPPQTKPEEIIKHKNSSDSNHFTDTPIYHIQIKKANDESNHHRSEEDQNSNRSKGRDLLGVGFPQKRERLCSDSESLSMKDNFNSGILSSNLVDSEIQSPPANRELAKDGPISDRLNVMSFDKLTTAPSTSIKKVPSKGDYDKPNIVRDLQTPLDNSTNVTIQSAEISQMRKKWMKVSHVIRSLALLQRQEVKNLKHAESVNVEINEYKLRTIKVVTPSGHDIVMKKDHADGAFDLIRRVQVFCECAEVGSPGHVDQLLKMIAKDPKKFMLEPADPEHLVNKKNNQGQTPLYIAAKNGNMQIVKIIIDNKADYLLKSKVHPTENIEEIPLQGAAKWGHVDVVKYLLNNGKYNADAIRASLKVSATKSVKQALMEYVRADKKRSKIAILCKCLGG